MLGQFLAAFIKRTILAISPSQVTLSLTVPSSSIVITRSGLCGCNADAAFQLGESCSIGVQMPPSIQSLVE